MERRVLHRARSLRPVALMAPAALLALGTACAQSPPPVAPAPPPPVQGKPMPANLNSISEAALADAHRLTGLPSDQLRVVSAEPVTWRDGSLGCPQPGMVYTEALVPGYRIRIQAGAQELDYHASRGGQLVLCPAGQSVEPLPSRDI